MPGSWSIFLGGVRPIGGWVPPKLPPVFCWEAIAQTFCWYHTRGKLVYVVFPTVGVFLRLWDCHHRFSQSFGIVDVLTTFLNRFVGRFMHNGHISLICSLRIFHQGLLFAIVEWFDHYDHFFPWEERCKMVQLLSFVSRQLALSGFGWWLSILYRLAGDLIGCTLV